MNDVWDQVAFLEQAASREAWSARYEQLRADWLAQETGWGQSLFIRQGMAAWMKTWPMVTRSKSETGASDAGPICTSSQAVVIHGERQRQLTRALANLILHRQQEVLA